MPFRHVAEHVKPVRLANRRKSRSDHWWRHGEPRPGLRRVGKELCRWLVTRRHRSTAFFVGFQSQMTLNTV
jgi:hypothetical protein